MLNNLCKQFFVISVFNSKDSLPWRRRRLSEGFVEEEEEEEQQISSGGENGLYGKYGLYGEEQGLELDQWLDEKERQQEKEQERSFLYSPSAAPVSRGWFSVPSCKTISSSSSSSVKTPGGVHATARRKPTARPTESPTGQPTARPTAHPSTEFPSSRSVFDQFSANDRFF